MNKPRISVVIRIGLLLVIGLSILVSGGIITYRRMVQVIDTFHKENISKSGLPEIRYLTTSLEQAENSIRLYGITQNRSYLRNYLKIATAIDSSIHQLYGHYPGDSSFTSKIDTIQLLFIEKKEIWTEMSRTWKQGSSYEEISAIGDTIRSQGTERDSSRRFLARLFSRKKEELDLSDSVILELLDELEQSERQFESSLIRQEAELVYASNKLSEALLSLMAQLNDYEAEQDRQKIKKADELAEEAYSLVSIFTLSGVFLGLFGLLVLAVYIRKSQAYNTVLIQSREKAEELAKSKELFMANVSHEIRTPLNAIIGFIKQILSSDIGQDVREKLEIVDSAGDQLIRLINDVLDFSKLQSGKLVLQNSHFLPGKSVEELCLLFREAAKKNGNSLSYHIDGIQHPALYGDLHRFKQILYNLISNAVKFTRNGSVDVYASTYGQKDQLVLELKVRDTGIGIENTKKETIFEEYSQANDEITMRYGGTGLGLSMVKKLVELFHGSVELNSQEGEGTEIRCRLYFEEGTQEGVEEAIEHPSQVSLPESMRILVVDDEPYNLALICHILDKWRIGYDKAMSGPEALDSIQKNSYDLVLIDFRMPGMSGNEATYTIRNTLNLSKDSLPVVGITADNISGTRKEELMKLFNGIIVKPFLEKELLQVLKEFLKSHKKNETNQKLGSLSNLIRSSDNDWAFIKTMIAQFEESSLSGLNQMKIALEQNEPGKLADLAHKLGAPVRHLKISRLLLLLKEIEKKSGSSETDDLGKLIDQAEQLVKRAVDNLYKELEESGP